MIDWSYSLLSSSEQQCFDAVALFETSFSWKAAQAIVSADGEDALALLDSLVDKSLVATIRSGDTVGYYLFDVVRDFACRRMETSADAADSARRYVDYYFGYLDSLTSPGVDEDHMIGEVDREWENIRGALRRAIDEKLDPERARLVIPKLWRFWLSAGRGREGLYWINRALESGKLRRGERVELLDAAARMAAADQQYAELEPLAQELVKEREAAGDSKPLGDALFMLANARHNLGASGEAEALFQRALDQFERSGSRRGTALVLGSLGTIIEQQTVSDQARFDEARALLERSLAIFREEQVVLSCAQALENLGVVCMRAGDLKQALAYIWESLALYRQHGNTDRLAIAHISMADVYLQSQQPLQALSELQAGRRMLGDDPRGPFTAYYAESSFKVALDLNAFETAAQLYGFAQRYRQIIRMPMQPAEQTAMRLRNTTLSEALGASAAEQLISRGRSLSLSTVDALVATLGAGPIGAADDRTAVSEEPPPKVSRPMVQRGHVTLRIAEAAKYPAVFFTANGAWGKSVALEHYLAGIGIRALHIRLEEPVATPERFVELFHREIASSLPSALNAALRTAADSPAALLLSYLAQYRGAIVIDNLHHVEHDPRIPQLLFNAIGATRSKIRWFLLSRRRGQAPIGTCVAYGLAERPIDEAALAFTLEDAMDYARLLRIPVTEQECEAVVHLTDGWPLAVNLALQAQLTAIAMPPLDRRAFVERETTSLASFYLREEVFHTLSLEQQRILLTTSAMPSDVRIDVLRQLDPAVEQTLLDLCAATPMKAVSDGVYRLPPLFKRFLQSELAESPERAAICAALADAYVRVGDPVSAIKVLLDVARYDAALEILAAYEQSWSNADWPDLLEIVVARLPAQLHDTNPTVLLARAAVVDRQNRFDQALQLLRSARSSPDAQFRLCVACAEAALCLNNEQPVNAKRLEVAMAEATTDPMMLLRAKALLCSAYCDEGNYEAARLLRETVASAAGDLVVDERTIDIVYWAALAHYRLADYGTAERLALQITRSGHLNEPWLFLAQAHDLLSRIALNTSASFDDVVQHNGAAILSGHKLGNIRYYSIYLQRRCTFLFYNGGLELVELAMNQADTNRSRLWSTYSAIFRFLTEIR
ncbi:MAG TPA: tetratricopeptide repeat protein, partial [Candidatus Acidoferrales bacterium]|nr:tetratricopeptide repeat protein [Candidatus Acidoferrales bacterium]